MSTQAGGAAKKAKSKPSTSTKAKIASMSKNKSTGIGTSKSRVKNASRLSSTVKHVRIDYQNASGSSADRLRAAEGVVRNGALVLVYSPMCGFCVRLRDAWNDAARMVTARGDAHVLEIDSRVLGEASQQAPQSNLVRALTGANYRGVPHIMFVTSDQSYLYNGDRSVDSLVTFTRRSAGG